MNYWGTCHLISLTHLKPIISILDEPFGFHIVLMVFLFGVILARIIYVNWLDGATNLNEPNHEVINGLVIANECSCDQVGPEYYRVSQTLLI